jgi:hypothetical protein
MAIRAALVLGLAGILAASIFGLFFRSSRATRDTVQVTGAATEPFEADVVKWAITLSRQVPTDGLGTGYAALREDRAQVVQHLVQAGVPQEAVNIQPVSANPRWDQYGTQVGYSLDQGLTVIAENGGRELEAIALDPGPLLERGIVLQYSRLEYFFSGIDELKHQLLSQATADARRRAEEIAGGSDMTIDKIVSARAGVFQITAPFSTEVTDYGVHDTSTRKKEITVTVHATFSVD